MNHLFVYLICIACGTDTLSTQTEQLYCKVVETSVCGCYGFPPDDETIQNSWKLVRKYGSDVVDTSRQVRFLLDSITSPSFAIDMSERIDASHGMDTVVTNRNEIEGLVVPIKSTSDNKFRATIKAEWNNYLGAVWFFPHSFAVEDIEAELKKTDRYAMAFIAIRDKSWKTKVWLSPRMAKDNNGNPTVAYDLVIPGLPICKDNYSRKIWTPPAESDIDCMRIFNE